MIYYVAHKYGGDVKNIEKAARITHRLQINDTENTYICPLLAFLHLDYNELGFDTEMALCLDILSVSDSLIVASDVSIGVRAEIDFAELVGMEVIYLEDKYREV